MEKLNSKALLVAHSDKEYVQKLRRQQRDMLTIAEHMFGPRDLSYIIVGIEFVDDGPYIWYPLVPGKKDNTDIIIRLSSPAAQNMAQAYFQMAHETVHLLSPSRGQNATNLEEGVACFFSVYYMETILRQPALRYNMKSYQRVLDLGHAPTKRGHTLHWKITRASAIVKRYQQRRNTQGISRMYG